MIQQQQQQSNTLVLIPKQQSFVQNDVSPLALWATHSLPAIMASLLSKLIMLFICHRVLLSIFKPEIVMKGCVDLFLMLPVLL